MGLRRWIQNRPHALERVWQVAEWTLLRLNPFISRVGYDRAARIILPVEDVSKKLLFNCQTCGQCILHSTGMTCSMNCPKNIRNGPCGGVRLDGHCEVKPEMMCVWVDAYDRSLKMPVYGHEMSSEQPPVNWQLEDTSAWINMLTGADRPRKET